MSTLEGTAGRQQQQQQTPGGVFFFVRLFSMSCCLFLTCSAAVLLASVPLAETAGGIEYLQLIIVLAVWVKMPLFWVRMSRRARGTAVASSVGCMLFSCKLGKVCRRLSSGGMGDSRRIPRFLIAHKVPQSSAKPVLHICVCSNACDK